MTRPKFWQLVYRMAHRNPTPIPTPLDPITHYTPTPPSPGRVLCSVLVTIFHGRITKHIKSWSPIKLELTEILSNLSQRRLDNRVFPKWILYRFYRICKIFFVKRVSFEPTTSCIRDRDEYHSAMKTQVTKRIFKLLPNSCFSNLSESVETAECT